MTAVDDRRDMRIRASAADAAHRVAPWRGDIAWWVVAIQGAIGLVLGLWLLLNQGAGEPVLAVVGLLVLGIASMWAWSAMRSDLPQVVLGWRGLRAGAGLLAGLLVVLDFVVDFLTVPAALVVLSIGLVVVGLIGIAEWIVGRDEMRWRWPTLTGPVVAASFGLILLLSRLQTAPIFLQVIAATALVLGVLLLVRAGMLFREERLLRGTGSAVGASSVPTPIPQASAGSVAPAVTVRSAAATQGPDADGPGDPQAGG